VDTERLAVLLAELAARHRVPGAQLAVRAGGTTYAVETGEPLADSGRPVTRETAVPTGSVTKALTAALALIPVADGDVGLDDPLQDHLPDLASLRTPVTLRQVLSHTSGLPAGPDSAAAADLTTRRCLARHCTDDALVAPPGTVFSYSNLGYAAAGRLVEEVTGMEWADAVEALLLEPLGIPADVQGGSSSGRPVATGHAVNPATGRAVPVRQLLAPVETAAGGLSLSATDLAAVGAAYADRDSAGPLPGGLLAAMTRPVPGADPCGLADGWGLGLALFRPTGTDWWGHDGNAMGTSCHLRLDPAGGTVVAFTANAGSGTRMWADLAARCEPLLGVPVPGPTAWQPPAARCPHTERLTGVYVNGGTRYRVAAADGPDALTLSVDGDPPIGLRCHADLRCSLVDPDTGELLPGGRFTLDPATGSAVRLQITGRTGRCTG
jgi:CubicO group peptidase (beta-lactamase class C family)